MTENIEYSDSDLSPMMDEDNNYRYDEGFESAGYSEVNPEENGADFGMFDDGDMDFGPLGEDEFDDGYEE